MFRLTVAVTLGALLAAAPMAMAQQGKIVHDAEYYILEAQNGEKWAADELRSVNSQIEYLLRDSLRRAGRLGRAPDRPSDLES